MTLDNIVQVILFILGAASIYLVSNPTSKYFKYGFIFGLASQPFWYYATLKKELYGMFCLALFYTFSWARGVYFNFIKKPKEEEKK